MEENVKHLTNAVIRKTPVVPFVVAGRFGGWVFVNICIHIPPPTSLPVHRFITILRPTIFRDPLSLSPLRSTVCFCSSVPSSVCRHIYTKTVNLRSTFNPNIVIRKYLPKFMPKIKSKKKTIKKFIKSTLHNKLS